MVDTGFSDHFGIETLLGIIRCSNYSKNVSLQPITRCAFTKWINVKMGNWEYINYIEIAIEKKRVNQRNYKSFVTLGVTIKEYMANFK